MIPEDCYYTDQHMWLRPEDDEVILLGVTEPLLRRTGPLLSVSLLDADDPIMPGIPFGEVEGIDHSQLLSLPTEADIVEVNEEAIALPERVSDDPYGDGWLARITIDDAQHQLIQLMTVHSYRDFVKADLGEDYVDE